MSIADIIDGIIGKKKQQEHSELPWYCVLEEMACINPETSCMNCEVYERRKKEWNADETR